MSPSDSSQLPDHSDMASQMASNVGTDVLERHSLISSTHPEIVSQDPYRKNCNVPWGKMYLRKSYCLVILIIITFNHTVQYNMQSDIIYILSELPHICT